MQHGKEAPPVAVGVENQLWSLQELVEQTSQ